MTVADPRDLNADVILRPKSAKTILLAVAFAAYQLEYER